MSKNDAPAKGDGVQSTAGSQGTSSIVKNAKDVTENAPSVIPGPGPGTRVTSMPSDGVTFDGMGEGDVGDETGVGPYVVVTNSMVTGHSGSFPQGRVLRLSHFVADYHDPEKVTQNEVIARRLFDLNALRLATGEEEGQHTVEVGLDSPALRAERNRRIELEKKLAKFEGHQASGVVPRTPSTERLTGVIDPSSGKQIEGNWE